MIKRGEFPAPVNISPRRIAFVEEQVDQWIAERIRASKESGWENSSGMQIARKMAAAKKAKRAQCEEAPAQPKRRPGRPRKQPAEQHAE